jgi:hypothetical protein
MVCADTITRHLGKGDAEYVFDGHSSSIFAPFSCRKQDTDNTRYTKHANFEGHIHPFRRRKECWIISQHKCQAVIRIEQTSAVPVVDMRQPRDQNRRYASLVPF